MRITKLFRLHLVGGVALLTAAAPGLAQNAAPTHGGNRSAVEIGTATVATRATNLRRQPIAITFLTVALQDRTAQSVRTAIAASSLSRPGQN
jgi:hypothetical protein